MFYTSPESRGPRGKGEATNIPDFLLLTLLLMDQWCSQTNSANITVNWHLVNTGVKCALDGLFAEWLLCCLSSHGWSRQEKETAVRTEEAPALSLWESNGAVVSPLYCVWIISPLGVSPFPHSSHKLPSEMPPHSTQLALPGLKHGVLQKREKPNKTSSTAGLLLECMFGLQGDFPRLLEANGNQLNSDYWRAKGALIVTNMTTHREHEWEEEDGHRKFHMDRILEKLLDEGKNLLLEMLLPSLLFKCILKNVFDGDSPEKSSVFPTVLPI